MDICLRHSWCRKRAFDLAQPYVILALALIMWAGALTVLSNLAIWNW